MMRRMILVAFLPLLMGGCAMHVAKLGVITTRNIVLDGQEVELVTSGAEGRSGNVYVFPFFLSGHTPSIEEAVENVLEEHDGDFMSNVEIRRETIVLLFVDSVAFTVKGDVMRLKRGSQ